MPNSGWWRWTLLGAWIWATALQYFFLCLLGPLEEGVHYPETRWPDRLLPYSVPVSANSSFNKLFELIYCTMGVFVFYLWATIEHQRLFRMPYWFWGPVLGETYQQSRLFKQATLHLGVDLNTRLSFGKIGVNFFFPAIHLFPSGG